MSAVPCVYGMGPIRLLASFWASTDPVFLTVECPRGSKFSQGPWESDTPQGRAWHPSVRPMPKPSLEPTHRFGFADISGRARFVQQKPGVYNGWKTSRLNIAVQASFSQNTFSDKGKTHFYTLALGQLMQSLEATSQQNATTRPQVVQWGSS